MRNPNAYLERFENWEDNEAIHAREFETEINNEYLNGEIQAAIKHR